MAGGAFELRLTELEAYQLPQLVGAGQVVGEVVRLAREAVDDRKPAEPYAGAGRRGLGDCGDTSSGEERAVAAILQLEATSDGACRRHRSIGLTAGSEEEG